MVTSIIIVISGILSGWYIPSKVYKSRLEILLVPSYVHLCPTRFTKIVLFCFVLRRPRS